MTGRVISKCMAAEAYDVGNGAQVMLDAHTAQYYLDKTINEDTRERLPE